MFCWDSYVVERMMQWTNPLLPTVVRAKEGKRKEGLWGVSGLRLVGGRRAVFI